MAFWPVFREALAFVCVCVCVKGAKSADILPIHTYAQLVNTECTLISQPHTVQGKCKNGSEK